MALDFRLIIKLAPREPRSANLHPTFSVLTYCRISFLLPTRVTEVKWIAGKQIYAFFLFIHSSISYLSNIHSTYSVPSTLLGIFEAMDLICTCVETTKIPYWYVMSQKTHAQCTTIGHKIHMWVKGRQGCNSNLFFSWVDNEMWVEFNHESFM